MQQITMKKDIQPAVDRLNRIMGKPPQPYVRGEDGRYRAQIGNYHIDQSYGAYALVQMVNEASGVRDVLGGRFSKRELYHNIHSYIRGIEAEMLAREQEKESA
jgi:hypothetical protein